MQLVGYKEVVPLACKLHQFGCISCLWNCAECKDGSLHKQVFNQEECKDTPCKSYVYFD